MNENMEYILDTNTATFVLDDKLWERELAIIMRTRPELNVSWKQAQGGDVILPWATSSLDGSRLETWPKSCATAHGTQRAVDRNSGEWLYMRLVWIRIYAIIMKIVHKVFNIE